MFTAGATIHVQRPVVEVFRFVADARNRPQWDDSVESEELTSAGPIGVGTTVRTTLRTMGRKYRYDWVITEFQAPWRITITSTSGPLPTTLSYRLTDRVTDTEVGFTVSGYPAGAMRLLQPLIARSTQANLDRGFARLQELLNADPPLVTFGDAHKTPAARLNAERDMPMGPMG